MVDFAGFLMPIHYSSQIEEHHAVRQSAGVFDVSHILATEVIGEDASAFLQYVLANDVAKLVNGKALYSCMLNEQGEVIDDLLVYRLSPTQYSTAWLPMPAHGIKNHLVHSSLNEPKPLKSH